MVATQIFLRNHPYSLGKMVPPILTCAYFSSRGLVKTHQRDMFCLAEFSWKNDPSWRPQTRIDTESSKHPNHPIDSWRPVSRPIIAKFSSCWKQRPGNFMGTKKKGRPGKMEIPGFCFFFKWMEIHWELFIGSCSERNRKGEIREKTIGKNIQKPKNVRPCWKERISHVP